MKPKESAECHQNLSSRVGSGHETIYSVPTVRHSRQYLQYWKTEKTHILIRHVTVPGRNPVLNHQCVEALYCRPFVKGGAHEHMAVFNHQCVEALYCRPFVKGGAHEHMAVLNHQCVEALYCRPFVKGGAHEHMAVFNHQCVEALYCRSFVKGGAHEHMAVFNHQCVAVLQTFWGS